MLKRISLFKKIASIWKKIHLSDKCLFIFMCALLIQATFGLFFRVGDGGSTNGIDVIVRTSAAAIFGYFLSGNFAKEKKEEKSCDTCKPTEKVEIETMDGDDSPEDYEKKSVYEEDEVTGQVQIIIATVVGMFCFIVLTVIRNSMNAMQASDATQDATAVVSMFRDFVSGCVGFLIGSPTDGKKR